MGRQSAAAMVVRRAAATVVILLLASLGALQTRQAGAQCSAQQLDCQNVTPPSHTEPNILLVVGDDQGYCHWGFMAGRCSGSGDACVSNVGCPAGETCVPGGTCQGDATKRCREDADCSVQGTTGPCVFNGSVQIAELTCRNRQPARPKGVSKLCPNKGDDRRGAAKRHFKFDRSDFPCYQTQTHSPLLQPALVTPAFDALAAGGALFPRAHVAGMSCKPSRATILLGKHQRHLQYLFSPYGSGRGRHECQVTDTEEADPAQGCRRGSDCPAGASTCGNVRAVAHWLRHGHYCSGLVTHPCQDDSDCPQGTAACVAADYKAFLFGKGEVLNESQGGFEGGEEHAGTLLGKFMCEGDPNCEAAARGTAIPDVARTDKSRGVKAVTDAIDGLITRDVGPSGNPSAKLEHPFFVWYAPKIPHKGRGLEPAFYDQRYYNEKRERIYFGRITQLDRGVDAIIDYLKTTCVCGRDDTGTVVPQALYDNTIVVVVADQGFFLPGAKNGSWPLENTHRTPILISTPAQRAGQGPARVFASELAHSIDIMPTLMAFAGVGRPCTQDADCRSDERCRPVDAAGTASFCVYAFARNLRPFIEGSSSHVREVQFGELGTNGVRSSGGKPRYVIPRPGLIGACATTKAQSPDHNGVYHAKPCLADSDCEPGDRCLFPEVEPDGNGKVCVNNPGMVCSADDQCAPAALCSGAHCAYSAALGSFADFGKPPPAQLSDGAPCTSASDCLPEPGVCRPLLLKVETNGQGEVKKVYNLDWDPDEKHNLLDIDATILQPRQGGGVSMETKLKACIEDFWNLGTDGHWGGPRSGTDCPTGWVP